MNYYVNDPAGVIFAERLNKRGCFEFQNSANICRTIGDGGDNGRAFSSMIGGCAGVPVCHLHSQVPHYTRGQCSTKLPASLSRRKIIETNSAGFPKCFDCGTIECGGVVLHT